MTSARRGFRTYAWAVLAITLAVTLWGAYVRASGSGAGCGAHWPLCNGVVVPRLPRTATVIEFLHRASSGVDLVLVLGLLVWAVWQYPRGHRVRAGAYFSTAFILCEALIGAALVLLGWVDQNSSTGRAITLPLHLVNTLFLLASLALTALWSGSGSEPGPGGGSRGRTMLRLSAGAILLLATAICGAINALGDTLFPAASVAAGMRQDFAPGTRLLLRLRTLHPALAVITGLYLIYLVVDRTAAAQKKPVSRDPLSPGRFGVGLIAAVLTQWTLGAADIALLAPTWLQLVHLCVADVVWILFVLYSNHALQMD